MPGVALRPRFTPVIAKNDRGFRCLKKGVAQYGSFVA
jgi:hypothetical protein